MAGGYADWRGHVIVCGLRGVGLRIVEELNLSGVPAVVIDDDPDVRLARILTSWGVPHIAASSRIAETLTGAGLAGATAVICVQHDDLYTLETALLTRQLPQDVRVVVQLGNPAVGRALSQVGVSVLDVAGLSAPSVVEACLQSGAQEIRLDRKSTRLNSNHLVISYAGFLLKKRRDKDTITPWLGAGRVGAGRRDSAGCG